MWKERTSTYNLTKKGNKKKKEDRSDIGKKRRETKPSPILRKRRPDFLRVGHPLNQNETSEIGGKVARGKWGFEHLSSKVEVMRNKISLSESGN